MIQNIFEGRQESNRKSSGWKNSRKSKTPEEEFHYSLDCETILFLASKKFIGAMLSRWIVEMSLEFWITINGESRLIASTGQSSKRKRLVEQVRQLVPITRYENGSQKRLQKILMERCDDKS